jgi:hypothetical protein
MAEKKEIPKYIIRESVFLNHRYIMADQNTPVLIQTVTRPNAKWEPQNEAACEMFEKLAERLDKISPKEGTPTSSHIAVITMKRAVAKFRGEPLPEDEFLDEEPQDPVGFVPTVRQPKDAVSALRDAAAPRIVNMDGQLQTGMAAPLPDILGGEPAAEETAATTEETAPVAEEVPTEPSLEGDPNADTLAGQQTRKPRRAK